MSAIVLPEELRAITIRQPWASLIAGGVKTIETRPRSTSYRGPVLIHAGAEVDHAAAANLDNALHDIGMCFTDWQGTGRHHAQGLASGVRGAVIAVANLVDSLPIIDRWGSGEDDGGFVLTHEDDDRLTCVAYAGDYTSELPFGDFTPGRHGLLLADVVRLPSPVPARGQQAVPWRLPEDVARRVRRQLAVAS